MKLKLIDSESQPHSGYGAGAGSIDRIVYECPCGEGTVVYEKDNIPGFKDKSIRPNCVKCSIKYNFSKGTAKLK